MNYTIDYKIIYNDWDVETVINEKVECNDSVGDRIGIDSKSNTLWFSSFVNPDDEEVRDFIRNYFKDYRSVLGFIRRTGR